MRISGFSVYRIHRPVQQHFSPSNKYCVIKNKYRIRGSDRASYEKSRHKHTFDLLGSKFVDAEVLLKFIIAGMADLREPTSISAIAFYNAFDHYWSIYEKQEILHNSLLTYRLEQDTIALSRKHQEDYGDGNLSMFFKEKQTGDSYTPFIREVLDQNITKETALLIDSLFKTSVIETFETDDPLWNERIRPKLLSYKTLLFESGLYSVALPSAKQKAIELVRQYFPRLSESQSTSKRKETN